MPIFLNYIQMHLVCQIQRVYFITFVVSFTLVIIRVVLLFEQVVRLKHQQQQKKIFNGLCSFKTGLNRPCFQMSQ